MLTTNGKCCSSCGEFDLQEKTIQKAIFKIGDTYFQVRKFPGYVCSYCDEIQIAEDVKNMFTNILGQGLYKAVKEIEVPIYELNTNKININKLVYNEKRVECTYCGNKFKKEVSLLPIIKDGDILYFISNVPMKKCINCGEGKVLSEEVSSKMRQLQRDIEEEKVQPKQSMKYIVVNFR